MGPRSSALHVCDRHVRCATQIGSAIWGELAVIAGLPAAPTFAAAGAILGIPLTWRWKLQTVANIDFSPSLHWPDPVTTHAIEADRGPVLVTVEYRIDPNNRKAFLYELGKNSRERRRDGAYDWGIFEDPADASRFIETFLTDSWLEHLRLHRRVTKADRVSEEAINRFQIGEAPKTTHLISALRPLMIVGPVRFIPQWSAKRGLDSPAWT